jgi:hypothetical protein
MKKYKNVRTNYEVLDKIICDICGGEYEEEDGWTRNNTEITMKCGEVFPECDTRTKYSVDCCPDCFEDKIIPLIEKTFKIKFREEE